MTTTRTEAASHIKKTPDQWRGTDRTLNLSDDLGGLVQVNVSLCSVSTLVTYYIVLFVNGLGLMPLYVFGCNACGETIEVLQKYNDEWPVCNRCTKQMSKKVALTSFALRGEGWAKDNYGLKSTG